LSVEELPLERIEWRFEDGENGGIAPVLSAKWEVEGAKFAHRLTHTRPPRF